MLIGVILISQISVTIEEVVFSHNVMCTLFKNCDCYIYLVFIYYKLTNRLLIITAGSGNIGLIL